MSVEEKYASPIAKKLKNKGENLTRNSQNTDRNIFNKFMASIDDTECEQNNMVAMKCNVEDDDIVLNKQIRKQILGSVRDNRRGSMMPVVLEQTIDGIKSKKMGKKVGHMPSMVGDGSNILNLSVEKMHNSDYDFAGKIKKGGPQRKQSKRKTNKVVSDLKIVAEISGDSDGQKFDNQKKEIQNLNKN